MKQTANYQLNQWDAEDRILRTDFNADNAKIDAALKRSADRMLGMICAWSGAADAIPAGWALCDGQNGTPDLRGRFVLGAGGGYTAGASGGEAEHKLTVSELPSHSHTLATATGVSEGSYVLPYNKTPSRPETGSVSTSDTGGGSAHNNMPPYYALCFVMYIGRDEG